MSARYDYEQERGGKWIRCGFSNAGSQDSAVELLEAMRGYCRAFSIPGEIRLVRVYEREDGTEAREAIRA